MGNLTHPTSCRHQTGQIEELLDKKEIQTMYLITLIHKKDIILYKSWAKCIELNKIESMRCDYYVLCTHPSYHADWF